MNCPNCGVWNTGRYCTNCGTQLMNNQVGQMSNQVGQMNNQVGQMSNQVGQMNNQVGQMNNQVGQMNNQVSQMNNQVGQLTIIRDKNFVGMAIAFKIFVDGVEVGKLKNGETVTYPIYYGQHRVEIKQHMNYGFKDIIIADWKPNVVLHCYVKMGILTNSIEII